MAFINCRYIPILLFFFNILKISYNFLLQIKYIQKLSNYSHIGRVDIYVNLTVVSIAYSQMLRKFIEVLLSKSLAL